TNAPSGIKTATASPTRFSPNNRLRPIAMPPLPDAESQLSPPLINIPVNWGWVWTVVYRAIIVLGLAGLFYLRSVFATQEQLSVSLAAITTSLEPLQNLAPRIIRLEERSNDRSLQLAAINDWRRQKDEIDTRLTTIIEQQQRQLDRQQTLIERLQPRP
ncbi:MAG: hypothetical protein Q8M02_13150, partial [Candidatus Didemnitutus sp.]|nr:hypothetical protein [Candidatus Didemnitutus sp.]